MTRYAVLAGALLLAACAGHTKVSQPAQTEWPPREMTQAECAVAGGNWGPVGLMRPDLRKCGGAGDGNRTRVSSLGSWRSTIELRPRAARATPPS